MHSRWTSCARIAAWQTARRQGLYQGFRVFSTHTHAPYLGPMQPRCLSCMHAHACKAAWHEGLVQGSLEVKTALQTMHMLWKLHDVQAAGNHVELEGIGVPLPNSK